MNKNIFRAYDIRGNSLTDLDDQTIKKIGYVLGKRILSNGHDCVYIGHDSRLSAATLQRSLVSGFNSAGVKAIGLGLVPTPIVYYATKIGKTPNGVMITGSHNPKDDNGLKIVLNDNAVSGLELLEEVTKQDTILEVPEDFEIFDIVPTYLAEVTKKVEISNKLKVVLDAGNGAAGVVADLVFCALGVETISIHKEPDGNFPNHHPDPSKEKNLADLILNVKKHNADFGFAFDGDGDRVGMVTNTGESVLADHLIMMLTEHYLQKRNGPVIFDVKCSNQLAELVEELGGKPIMEKTGHFNIKKAIKEHHAVLGGEMSGHIFINHDWYGFDDAVFTAAVLSHIVASNKLSASEIIKKFPKTFSTPELNLDVTDDAKFEMVDRFKNEMSFPGAEFNTIDGVRVTIGSAWGLMRASNTSPKLVFRFEAGTQKELEEIQDLFLQNLNRIFPNFPINFS